MHFHFALVAAATMVAATWTVGAAITGDPSADGWTPVGNSLDSGVYVRGSANYGFDAYTLSFTIQTSSSLHMSAGSLSWMTGDTVLGVGGVFQTLTANDAGWGAFTGNSVNSLLSPTTGLKLQAKFGSTAAGWTSSTVAPGLGDGLGSLNSGGPGSVQVRTSGSHPASFWSANSSVLYTPTSSGHIESSGNSSPNVAVSRIIYNYDTVTQKPGSWELLLNVTLLERLYGGGYYAPGDTAILTVQNGDGNYTDALVNISAVPEPTTVVASALLLLPLGMSAMRMLRDNRKA